MPIFSNFYPRRFLHAPTQNKFLIVLFFITFILILARVFLCNQTLGLDEAEQIVFAQKLARGYPGQPPLYTWIQYFIFKSLGPNLLSLALLKYSLLAACIYLCYLISSIYCKNKYLIYCATFSWMLIPSIGYDLLPHRTHVILALFSASLTWYWFIKPHKLTAQKWYFILGGIVGIGLLSKFNYLLFLLFFMLTAISIQEYRQIVFNRFIWISITVGLLISSPYWSWLLSHTSVGLNAAYKLRLPGKNQWNGILSLLEVTLYFLVPYILVRCVFPNAISIKKKDLSKVKTPFLHYLKINLIQGLHTKDASAKDLLLKRYHLGILPLLFFFVLAFRIYNFKTHWVVPLFFLFPVFLFSHISKNSYKFKSIKWYLGLCAGTQIAFLSLWILRTPYLASFPIETLIQEIKQDSKKIDSIASDSHWLLGSLMWRMSIYKGVLINSPKAWELVSGNTLLIWQGEENPPIANIASVIKKTNFYKTSASWTYQFKGY